ncbi:YdeI/OmpD-associated family protein [Arenibacter lacus]|uniref:YdeI/OmpD-associated family protein n=1 Tax=Arenibacter lacus TaxID=2608629 RepID=UPI00123DF01E|nr:YdeI/OmpD-associated family protein [Arenibacter lacus]
MEKSEKIEAYYAKEHPFKAGIAILREIALKTALVEDYKWGSPVYTIGNKNVVGILAFKSYFGLWFFNGVFLSDPKKVLENAQEGKTKALRHWKFTAITDIDKATVLAYLEEAIANQKKGKVLVPEKKKKMIVPPQLKQVLEENPSLKTCFTKLPPYKQKQYCEYIAEAKQEKTKRNRLEKCLPLIRQEIGLHDKYR